MATHIKAPTEVKAHGNIPKIIKEFVGIANTQTTGLSIAKMESPAGWIEPGQTPEFDEYTIVLKGCVTVETKEQAYEVKAGEAIFTPRGEWVRYSTPKDGAEYIAVCLPAFSPQTVHRDQ